MELLWFSKLSCAPIRLLVHGIESFALYLSASKDVAAPACHPNNVEGNVFSKHSSVKNPLEILCSTTIHHIFAERIHSLTFFLSSAYILQAIDWTYIFHELNYQLGAILLAASPRWYLYQAIDSKFCWMLPWAIVVTVLSLPSSVAWTYYAVIFGGALVFDFLDVGVTLPIWIYRLFRGKVRARSHVEYH